MSEANTGFILYDKVVEDPSKIDEHLKKSINLFISFVEYSLEIKAPPLTEFNETGSKIASGTISIALPILLKRNPSLRVLYICNGSSLVQQDQVNIDVVVATQNEAELLLNQSSLKFDLIIVRLNSLRYSLFSKLKNNLDTTSIRVK